MPSAISLRISLEDKGLYWKRGESLCYKTVEIQTFAQVDRRKKKVLQNVSGKRNSGSHKNITRSNNINTKTHTVFSCCVHLAFLCSQSICVETRGKSVSHMFSK